VQATSWCCVAQSIHKNADLDIDPVNAEQSKKMFCNKLGNAIDFHRKEICIFGNSSLPKLEKKTTNNKTVNNARVFVDFYKKCSNLFANSISNKKFRFRLVAVFVFYFGLPSS
jgi:hypothetical protein